MRITLDHYRILSVPIKADSPQLERAYEDRLRQQARREYSSEAVLARGKLLTKAYNILSNPETRAEYDGSFFAPEKSDYLSSHNSGLDSNQAVLAKKTVAVNPYIEIEPELLVGVLMILHELAEYEMVLHLGNDYLSNEAPNVDNNSTDVEGENSETEYNQKQDILLCLALSHLELSREQWRREQWEKAAISGQRGLDIIPQEQPMFFNLQAEIESELNLLKPYRVLAFLKNNNSNADSKSQGLQLLQEMLLERDGIEGNNNDPSGLKLDQFLCFIQQIRTYLTLQEQKELFLAEARRGSRPGSCVAAYSLIAEGYAYKKPDSIVQAQQIFRELSDSQDTHWERSICALLLGQTINAQEIITKSQETNTLELIEKRSQSSPDLLPGLCFYGERWLQKEVLAQFRDLKSRKMTLDEYFNDSEVQAYLEQISPVNQGNSRNVDSKLPAKSNLKPNLKSHSRLKSTAKTQSNFTSFTTLPSPSNQQFTTSSDNHSFPISKSSRQNKKKGINKRASTKAKASKVQSPANSPTLAEVVASKARQTASVSHHNHPINNDRESEFTRKGGVYNFPRSTTATVAPSTSLQHTSQVNASPKKATTVKTKIVRRKRRKPNAAFKMYGKSWLVLLGLICGIGTLGFVFTSNQLRSQSESQTVVESVTKPPTPESIPNSTQARTPANSANSVTPKPKKVEPETTATAKVDDATINQESARMAIQKWLDSKAAALGQEHQVERLNSILTASLLTQWSDRSNYYKQNNIYRQFKHDLKIRAVKIDAKNPNIATVEAEVKEVARHYQRGKLNQSQSYDDSLIVSYRLVRQDNSWLIQNSKVLQSL